MPASFAIRSQRLPLPPAPLAEFRALEECSRQMLAAAQTTQWAQFWQLALQCKQQIQAMQETTAKQNADVLPPGLGTEKQAILLRILQNDALIRVLADPTKASRTSKAQMFGSDSVQLH